MSRTRPDPGSLHLVAGTLLAVTVPLAAQAQPLFPALISLNAIQPGPWGIGDGTNGFWITRLESDRLGETVAHAGDVNGDGIDDIIVGASGFRRADNALTGAAYVLFGGSGVGGAGRVDPDLLNGANGFAVIDSTSTTSPDFTSGIGRAVSAAGDMNGDGIDDLAVAARDFFSNRDKTIVIFGQQGLGASGSVDIATLNGANGFEIRGVGYAVAPAGDVNGDGIDDLVIGDQLSSPNSVEYSGTSYVVFGGAQVGASGSVDAAAFDGTDGVTINGVGPSDFSGRSVSGAGDVNGDGIDDVLIGTYSGTPAGRDRAGTSYVVFGRSSFGTPGVIELANLNGQDGFVLNGIDAGERSGWSVSAAGDMNGDGIDDFVIGAPRGAPPGVQFYEGQSFVVFGSPGIGASGTFELSALDGSNGFAINGATTSTNMGYSVSHAGDVNGDGIDDIVLGASRAFEYAGESYVVFGEQGIGGSGQFELSALDGSNGFLLRGTSDDRIGAVVSSAGDVNADGIDDLLLGSRSKSRGQAYVVYGRAPAPECVADVTTDGTNPGDKAYGAPDGQATVADLSFFVEQWLAGDASVADVTTDGANPGDAGFGVADGQVTVSDLSYFVEQWLAGCP
ncbi:MAG: integrin alpha [Planctomycetota bacterium]